jgi:glycosyltransferase involved in cell wall biosynthesis
MSKIRILQVVNSLEIGGAEKVAVNLANYLEKKDYMSYVCTLCGLGPFSEYLKKNSIPIIQLKKKPIFMPGLIFLRLFIFLLHNKIDIITTHNTGPLLQTYWVTRFFKKIKILHVDHARCYPRESKQYPSYRYLSEKVYKIIAVSNELKTNLIKYEKISPQKIRVVQNGIDEKDFLSNIDSNLKKITLGLLLDSNVKILGLVARLSEEKGISYLLKSISIIKEKRKDFCLLIVGNGPLRSDLEKEAKLLGVSNHVCFLGERTDIPELLAIIDIFVLSSLREGLPMAILEAQAAKKAIIATDVGDNSNVISNEVSGILIPSKDPISLANAINYLLDNPDKRVAFGEAGYMNFKNRFSLQISAEKYIEEYQKMVS